MKIHLVDLQKRRIYPAEVNMENGRIQSIREIDHAPEETGYLLPGFVDAHVHIESSMLPPAEFARMAVVHGTVGTVSDPHEIANVLGSAGVYYMLDDAARTPFKFCFGAPSCVPATAFETAGAVMLSDEVEQLLENPSIGYLSEMMNFPGVLHGDAEVLAKIAAAHRLGKPVDGHAPGLRGEEARRYFAAGIATDHECFSYEEGREKAQLGVKILIREGSAARNFEALWPLLNEFPGQIMFCSDDKHPDDLVRGHINELVARAIANGCDLFDVLRAACIHPVEHYRLPVGLLREGDPADFIRVADLISFQVLETWLDGQKVAENGQSLLPRLVSEAPNQFLAQVKMAQMFQLRGKAGAGSFNLTPDPSREEEGRSDINQTSDHVASFLPFNLTSNDDETDGASEHVASPLSFPRGAGGEVNEVERDDASHTASIRLIEALDGQIVTGASTEQLSVVDGLLQTDPDRDILKIAVVNRYTLDAVPAVGFVRGFGLRQGALASSVAHDSHNIVAVGCDDQALADAVNAVIAARGGISATDGAGTTRSLPLPIAGLMSQQDGYTLAQDYAVLDAWTKSALGCALRAPFMVLSFLALPVIPKLKMTDLGLFDVEQFAFTDVVCGY